jgi:hypothetical protein
MVRDRRDRSSKRWPEEDETRPSEACGSTRLTTTSFEGRDAHLDEGVPLAHHDTTAVLWSPICRRLRSLRPIPVEI